jgi:hypothetical protein
MRLRRRAVAMVLALSAFVAPTVAAVVVPDPTWIGGLYDGGDGDEAAALVWDYGSAVVPAGFALLALLAAVVVAAPGPPAVGRFPHGSSSPRAPPAA